MIKVNTLKNICFRYLLELPQWSNSNKYPKHMFCEEIRTKQDLSYVSVFSLCVLYNSKFILMAMSFGTNAVFGNKCCRCNDGLLYRFILKAQFLLTHQVNFLTISEHCPKPLLNGEYGVAWPRSITKTRLLKYIDNFTSKNWKISDKKLIFFIFLLKNIDCGYSLEPPRWGSSNEYP